ncbi:biotin--[acetyl-CoA-carboxylase] ligase [Streptomyces californicus]
MLIAEEQTAGHGRLERSWTAPPRSGLFLSVYLEPGDIPVERWGWVPLLAGVAAATGLAKSAGVDMSLKWPNDLLVSVDGGERKTGGILEEFAGDGIVVGMGVNVSLRADELPPPPPGRWRSPGRSPPTARPCCAPSCARWRTGTERGGTRTATRPRAGSRRRTRRGARRWTAVCGPSCRAGTRWSARRSRSTGTAGFVLSTENGLQQPVSAGDIVHLRGVAGGLT